jgi:hypothetical protein
LYLSFGIVGAALALSLTMLNERACNEPKCIRGLALCCAPGSSFLLGGVDPLTNRAPPLPGLLSSLLEADFVVDAQTAARRPP